MLTEEEFYRRKIFYKENLLMLRAAHPSQIEEIDSWRKCQDYRIIQSKKSFIRTKLREYALREGIQLEISPELVYSIYQWWKNQPKKCYYCQLPEDDLETLRQLPGYLNKRYPMRGKSLEIDRKDSSGAYTDVNNLVLACYWCNNAKTDTFSEAEFKAIGRALKSIWERRLGKVLS